MSAEKLLNDVIDDDEVMVVTRDGKRVAVIVSAERYELWHRSLTELSEQGRLTHLWCAECDRDGAARCRSHGYDPAEEGVRRAERAGEEVKPDASAQR